MYDDNPTCFHLDDRLFLGEGVIETLRVMNGRPCYPQCHWLRLINTARFLDIDIDLSYHQWLKNLDACIPRIGQHGGIKVLLSGGRAKRGLHQCGVNPQLFYEPFNYQIKEQPVKLISAAWVRDSHNPLYSIKSTNYLESIIALKQARASQADDVVFFNKDDFMMETTVASIFMIKNNKLFTPSLNQGILPGILRSRIVEGHFDCDIACEETEIHKEVLLQADALFITNVLQGIRVVRSFNDKLYDQKNPYITTLQNKLVEDYLRNLG